MWQSSPLRQQGSGAAALGERIRQHGIQLSSQAVQIRCTGKAASKWLQSKNLQSSKQEKCFDFHKAAELFRF